MPYLSVNVEEGFAPHLAQEFVARYGGRSLFVRATADLFTLALARVLEASSKRQVEDPIARVADDDAVDCLSVLTRAVAEGKKILLSAATGSSPADSFEVAIDAALCAGSFGRWLAHFERREFKSSNTIAAQA
jgi:hypothetical protein